MSALPRLRGHGSLAAALNRQFLRAGLSPLITAKMRRGHRLIVDTRAQFQADVLYNQGEYDEAKIALLAALIRPGTTFVDLGANIGFYTVPLAVAAKAGGGVVVAFEPHPANYRRLSENVALNGLNDYVRLFELGLSSEEGEAELVLRQGFGIRT